MKVARYQGRSCYVPGEPVDCFYNFILYLCLGDKTGYDKIPHKEDSKYFITQGTTSKIMILCKIPELWEQGSLPIGYFNGKEIIPNEVNLNRKGLQIEKKLYMFIIIKIVFSVDQIEFH